MTNFFPNIIFFRPQLHGKTRDVQMKTWGDLVLRYQKFLNQPTININDDKSVLFANAELTRKLPVAARLVVMEELEKTNHAAPLDPKKRDLWEIYWYTLNEWSRLIYDWATNNAMIGTVCTTFEIVNGDNSTSEEFYGLDEQILLKALKRLQETGKCELIGDEGVKFF